MERNYELNRKPLLNIAQLADLLGVTQRTVRDWVFKGKMAEARNKTKWTLFLLSPGNLHNQEYDGYQKAGVGEIQIGPRSHDNIPGENGNET